MKFEIISDGACDLTKDYVSENNVKIVPFYVTFDGSKYYKEGIEVDYDQFYKKMIDEHSIPKSSLPSVGDYIEAFEPIINEDKPIICICITSKFSGSYNSACTAKDELMEKYPKAKIEVIDSTLNTVCEGLFVNEAVKLRDADVEFEDAIEKLHQIKDSGRIYFTVGSLEYLIKNGRIGKVAVIAGDKLGIKPVIVMNEGDISLGAVSRSRKKAKGSIIKLVNNYFEKNNLNKEDYNFIIGAGYVHDEMKEYLKELEAGLEVKFVTDVKAKIGATIACHTGPYAIGLAFLKKAKI